MRALAALGLLAALSPQEGARTSAPAAEAPPWEPVLAEASEEGAQAIAGMKLAPGLAVELWAAEPLLANPVCLALDPSGAVYVAETFRHHEGVTDVREHMTWKEDDLASATVADRVALLERHEGDDFPSYALATERVRLLRDTDGDGKADLALVFADGFDDPAAGIGAGLLARGREVLYTCIPDLWLLRDRDGDGVAEERERLTTGYGVHIALLGHDLHGLRIGPDGRLWFSSGDRGFHVVSEDGRVLASPDTGAVLACELDGTGLEVVHAGLRNPQELAFDDFGDLFTGDNNSDGGDEARIVRILPGGDSGWRYPFQWLESPWTRGPWNEERLWKPAFAGQAAYLVPPIANHAAGPSGFTHHPGTGFDPAYAGRFFLVDFRGGARWSGIDAFELRPRGASFALGAVSEILRGALPTDCEFGFDGALWFCDWVHGWQKTGRGRVYRIVGPLGADDPLVAETARLLREGMAQRTSEELGRLLAHADQRVRLEAELALAARGPEGERRLEELTLGGLAVDDPRLARLARLHAIWGLGIAARSAPPVADALLALCADDDAEVRAQALRVLGERRYEPARRALVAGLADPEPRARLFAALGIGRIGASEARAGLVEALVATGEEDRDLRHALIEGLAGAATLDELAELLAHGSVDVRVAAVVALRRRAEVLPGARVLAPEAPAVAERIAGALDDRDARVVAEAARAIHDLPLAGALPSLAALAPELGRDERLAEVAVARRVLCALEDLGGEARAKALARAASRAGLDAKLRAEALAMLADWPRARALDRVLGRHAPRAAREGAQAPLAVEVGAALGAEPGAPEPVLAAWLALARAAPSVAALPALRALLADGARPVAARAGALETLAELAPDALDATLDRALADPDPALRAAALPLLARLAPEAARARAVALVGGGILAERRAAYALFARDPTPAAAFLLAAELARLDAGARPLELALDLERAARERLGLELPPENGHASVEALDARAALESALAEHEARRPADPELAPFIATLVGGDAARGERIFRERAELACLRCHAVDGSRDSAASIGPALTGLGARLGRLELLESIVVPSRRIAAGFEATAFVVAVGDEHDDVTLVVGRVVAEDDETVVVLDADGERAEVRVEAIRERRPDLSAMPAGQVELMSLAELRDLIEYLARL